MEFHLYFIIQVNLSNEEERITIKILFRQVVIIWIRVKGTTVVSSQIQLKK